MNNVSFSSLVFDKVGCCASHAWAEVQHENGRVSSVYDRGNGSYSVVTHAAGMLMRGEETYSDQAGVEARLADDAA